MENTHTHIELTPATSADYKTHRAVRQWLIFKPGSAPDSWHYFTGTRRAAEDHAETLNRTTPGAPWQLQSTGAKLANEQLLAAWVLHAEQQLPSRSTRSTWSRGVSEYISEILADRAHAMACYSYAQDIIETADELEHWCMAGADTWTQYSNGACTLVATEDISARLFPPSQRIRIGCTSAANAQVQALRTAGAFLRRTWRTFLRERTALNA